jgi:crotonobetainyl-CoA:carnitine CoA-transferase CaiB-like acyl-CoA transferase
MPKRDRTSERSGVLDGFRVVEFSQLIAAPFCGLTLADLGADVIKVETPHGDYVRTWARPGEESALFHALNRDKRSVLADLRTTEGRALAGSLVRAAEIVVENFGDGAREAIGLDYEDVAAANPRLMWCSISGLGRGGGGRAVDMTLQASMGITALTGEEDGPPCRAAIPIVDLMTGMYAVQSILEAVIRQGRTGSGAFIDCAMVDATAMLTTAPAALSLSGFSRPRRMGSQSDLFVPSAAFATSDGHYVHVLALSNGHWRAICTTIRRSEWLDDPRFVDNGARLAHREEIHREMAAALATNTAEHWAREIKAAGGFCERVREIEEVWADPILGDRELLLDTADPALHGIPLPVASLVRRPREALSPAPRLGEHTDEITRELSASQSLAG